MKEVQIVRLRGEDVFGRAEAIIPLYVKPPQELRLHTFQYVPPSNKNPYPEIILVFM